MKQQTTLLTPPDSLKEHNLLLYGSCNVKYSYAVKWNPSLVGTKILYGTCTFVQCSKVLCNGLVFKASLWKVSSTQVFLACTGE